MLKKLNNTTTLQENDDKNDGRHKPDNEPSARRLGRSSGAEDWRKEAVAAGTTAPRNIIARHSAFRGRRTNSEARCQELPQLAHSVQLEVHLGWSENKCFDFLIKKIFDILKLLFGSMKKITKKFLANLAHVILGAHRTGELKKEFKRIFKKCKKRDVVSSSARPAVTHRVPCRVDLTLIAALPRGQCRVGPLD